MIDAVGMAKLNGLDDLGEDLLHQIVSLIESARGCDGSAYITRGTKVHHNIREISIFQDPMNGNNIGVIRDDLV